MITSTTWARKRYAVLGLARSGAATVAALLASGAEVLAWDDDLAKCRAVEQAVSPEDRERLFIDDFTDWQEFDLNGLVVSPGVPLNRLPLAEVARAAGTPIIGDIELFAQARAELPTHKVVGITGTNGKSTTTALVTHILKTAGVPALMGGNIGLPILAQDSLPAGGVYVLELSSYQIDLTQTLDCDVAVLLNITPDHLDRYGGSFEAYAGSKFRLFSEMQTSRHLSIMIDDGETVTWLASELDDYREWSMLETDPGTSLTKAERWLGSQADWPALQGPHNFQNVAAAVETCRYLGVSKKGIAEGLRTFPGLPHRMERIATLGGVTWYDDSKATNPESTAPALAAFPRVHWILGGRAKGEDLDACLPHLGHVVAAYVIGEAGPAFANILSDKLQMVEHSVTLDVAVKSAADRAQRGEVVLLSPAAASFDQFRDYEHRGQVFRQLVEALA